MTRQFAADDYEAIRKSMEGLRPNKPQSDFEKALESGAAAAVPNGNAMSKNEISRYVAAAFTCKSVVCGPTFCGQCNDKPGQSNSAVHKCWAAGRCMTSRPRA